MRTHIAPDKVADVVWQRLTRAADDPRDAARIITLCTVTPEGNPSGRLMLLRGVDPGSCRIWCHSRRDSAKVADLRANPSFAVVIYDSADSVQIRLSGSARIHELDDEATKHFEQSILIRELHQPVAGSSPDPIWPGETELLIHASKRTSRKQFVVIEMKIESIDWTQVVDDKPLRVLLQADANWQAKTIQ